MKAARCLLVLIWLVFAATATVHAAPAADCPMAGMKHTLSVPMDQGAMPCCSQPAVIAAPQVMVLMVRTVEAVRLFPLPLAAPAGHRVAAEPHPPKRS